MIKKYKQFNESSKNRLSELTDSDGYFKSVFDKNTIGYLEELCEFVYLGDNTTEEKLKHILMLEELITKHLSKMGIGYRPTWSKKLM